MTIEDKILKLKKLQKTDIKQFLNDLSKLIQEWKMLSKNEKSRLRKQFKEYEQIGKELYQELYFKTSIENKDVTSSILKGAKNIINEDGMIDKDRYLSRILDSYQNDDKDKAIKLMKVLVNKATFRAETLISTMSIANNRANAFTKAADKGIKKFKYVGAESNAREFCRTKVNKVYTIEEINNLDNGQGLPVKYFCGGYNCRHRWVAVAETLNIQGIKNSKLEYNPKDLKQDIRKHAVKFGLTDEEYIKEAQTVVRESNEYYSQEFKGYLQAAFVGERGYVTTDYDGTIKGYFYYKKENKTKAITNLKKIKNWIKLK